MNSLFKYFIDQINQLSEYITHVFILMPKDLQQIQCRTLGLKRLCLFTISNISQRIS